MQKQKKSREIEYFSPYRLLFSSFDGAVNYSFVGVHGLKASFHGVKGMADDESSST